MNPYFLSKKGFIVLSHAYYIYAQTFVDTYSKIAFVKLYDRKNAMVAADLLNDKVLPFFQQYELPLLQILIGRSTEYCGRREHHEYQLYEVVWSFRAIIFLFLILL